MLSFVSSTSMQQTFKLLCLTASRSLSSFEKQFIYTRFKCRFSSPVFNPTFWGFSLKMTFVMALVLSMKGHFNVVLENSVVFAVFTVLCCRCIVPFVCLSSTFAPGVLSEISTDSCKNINSAWHISLQSLKHSVLAAFSLSVYSFCLLHGHKKVLLNFLYRRINSWIKEAVGLQKVLLNSRMWEDDVVDGMCICVLSLLLPGLDFQDLLLWEQD